MLFATGAFVGSMHRTGQSDSDLNALVSMSAAAQNVPAVSIMSSTMTQVRPFTSPMSCLASTVLRLLVERVLWIMAISVPNELVPKVRALIDRRGGG